MTKPSWILEDYISPRVLPKEQIFSWIKWDPELDYDKIIIKSEPDIDYQRILNVDEKVFDQAKVKEFDVVEFKDGTVVIEKNIVQIPGFVGFKAVYKLIPEDEKKLSFLIEFYHKDKQIGRTELVTDLVRPKLVFTDEPTTGIILDQYNPIIQPLAFTLQNKGKGMVEELIPFIDIQSWQVKSMSVTIQNIKEKDTNTKPIFVETTIGNIPKIIIKGYGMGIIGMGFQYVDKLGNKYETRLANVPLKIPQKQTLEIPVTSDIEGKHALLLEPKIV